MSNLQGFIKLSDAEVAAEVVKGNTPLFELLIRRVNPYLYKVGRSYGYAHEDVEDLMQDTFISAYLSLAKFENRSSFKTWIIKIMLNNCYRRSQKYSVKNGADAEKVITEKSTPMFPTQHPENTGKTVLNRELSHVIENAIEKIPVEYRMVFSLREINGMSVAETGEALGLTESNVKVRLNRAKSMLRKEIERSYSPEDVYEFNLVYCDKMVDRVMSALEVIRHNKPL